MRFEIKLVVLLLLYSGMICAQDIPDTSSKPPPVQRNEVYTYVEVMPEFPGGPDALARYLKENLKYPDEANREGIQGKVYVTFIVEADGKVSNAKVLRGIGGGCDEEALRVVNAMPEWAPGTQNGRNVAVQFNLPVRFIIAVDASPKTNAGGAIKPAKDSIYEQVSQRAKYPGGDDARKDYINYNLKYPQIALTTKVQGKVTVRFVVHADGSLSDFMIMPCGFARIATS